MLSQEDRKYGLLSRSEDRGIEWIAALLRVTLEIRQRDGAEL